MLIKEIFAFILIKLSNSASIRGTYVTCDTLIWVHIYARSYGFAVLICTVAEAPYIFGIVIDSSNKYLAYWQLYYFCSLHFVE